jgi:hypothetical protein
MITLEFSYKGCWAAVSIASARQSGITYPWRLPAPWLISARCDAIAGSLPIWDRLAGLRVTFTMFYSNR